MGILTGVRVLELDTGWSGPICGRLLADLGADVVKLEDPEGDPLRQSAPAGSAASEGPFEFVNAGKRLVAIDPASPGSMVAIRSLLGRADVILEGHSLPAWADEAAVGPRAVRCSVSPFGRSGPLSGRAASDLTLQAVSGLLEVTGFPSDPPTRTGPPVISYATALFAFIGVMAALDERLDSGRGEEIEVAAYDCAVAYLAAYIPLYLATGRSPSRQGNRGTTTVPWNTYPTRTGSIVLCTSTDAQWHALLRLAGREDLVGDPRYATASDRLACADEVDRIVEGWTREHTTPEVLELAAANRLAAGVVRPIEELRELRGPVLQLAEADGPPKPCRAVSPGAVAADWQRPEAGSAGAARPRAPGSPPLAGIRVLELGHYTAAPYGSRMLAALGAEVIKVEPRNGEIMRRYRPTVNGEGHFFQINNASKRTVTLDIRSPEGMEVLHGLVRESDVLVENLSAGTLDRLGLAYDTARELNDRLVYCSVKGFGTAGGSAKRLAYDTVIQAEAGMMATTGWPESGPVRAGISISDLLGSTLAVAEILCALYARRTSGEGALLEVSMHRVTAWTTQMYWPAAVCRDAEDGCRWGNRHPLLAPHGLFHTTDGVVALAVETDEQWVRLSECLEPPDGAYATAAERLAAVDRVEAAVGRWTERRDMSEVLEACAQRAIPAAPVLEVGATIDHAQTMARGLLQEVPGPQVAHGAAALLRLPISLARSRVRDPVSIGAAGADNAAVYSELLGLDDEDLRRLEDAEVV